MAALGEASEVEAGRDSGLGFPRVGSALGALAAGGGMNPSGGATRVVAAPEFVDSGRWGGFGELGTSVGGGAAACSGGTVALSAMVMARDIVATRCEVVAIS